MALLISPKFWIAVVVSVFLTAVSYFSYSAGKNTVQAAWDKDVLLRTELALKAEQEARKKEQTLVAEKQKAEEKYVQEKRKAVVAASNARAELDSLRNHLYSLKGPIPSATTSSVLGTNGTSSQERELLGQCAVALVGVAAEADQLTTVVRGLQEYINTVVFFKK